jgi:drug/metabolite transporter (DMT)-like permease
MLLILALGSAVTFGVADFTGGLAARRASALTVTVVAQVAGALFLVPAVFYVDGVVSGPAIVAGALAGLAGGSALVFYFRALAIGPMGVVAPLTGAVGAILPATAGLLLGEDLSLWAVAGAILGISAIVLAASARPISLSDKAHRMRGPLTALIAGMGFGLFFLALDRSPADSGVWPLVGARLSSLPLLGYLMALRRRGEHFRGWAALLAALSGISDMVANMLFLAATRAGLLALAVLITSMYPVVIALLARAVLKERLSGRQSSGVVLCMVSIAMMAVGSHVA